MNYRTVILLLLFCFYFIYFTKQIILKKHGINTNRLAKGSKPKQTQLIEICLLIATYATAMTQFLSIFLFARMGQFELPTAIRIVGACFVFCGVIIFLLAIIAMRDNWRAGIDKTQKTNMVTNGIYQYSRNPAFVGFDLLYIGTVLVFYNIFITILAIITIILLHLQILEEEKHLVSEFGETYIVYKDKVARYLFF